MARIDRSKRAAFDALARRDAARGTRRNESLLRGRLFRVTPGWRVGGIVGPQKARPKMGGRVLRGDGTTLTKPSVATRLRRSRRRHVGGRARTRR